MTSRTSAASDADVRTGGRASAYIGGVWLEGSQSFQTDDPYTGSAFGIAPECGAEEIGAAVRAAAAAAPQVATTPARERADLLNRVADLIRQRIEPLAVTMTLETGKAITDSRREVARSAETLALSAQEAVRMEGYHVPMDATAQGAGKLGIVLPFPMGVVAAITPFNAPLNLACHKLGPAIAAGNSVVLKPAPQASLTIHKLVELFHQAGVQPGWLNAVYGDAAGRMLVESRQVDAISFTGSSAVGAAIRRAAPLTPMTLELGGNGTTIVCADADIEAAAALCAVNAMRLAGQSCISVQNVCVERSVFARFEAHLVSAVEALTFGNPMEERTDLGPVISRRSAERVCDMVEAAVKDGTGLLIGGACDGAMVAPTVLTSRSAEMSIFKNEVFGPVVNLIPFDSLADPVKWINASRYGLQAGVFARSMETGLSLARSLRVGAVILNGSSTWRSDQAPYGGVKDSGSGREGPRFAIRHLSDERLILFNH